MKSIRLKGKLHVSTRDLTPEDQKHKLPTASIKSIALDGVPLSHAQEDGVSRHDRIADPRAVNPLDVVIEQETLAELWPLFEWLETDVPVEDREILLAFVEHGFSERLAADALGMHLATARAAIRRVRRSVPKNLAALAGATA